MADMFKNQLQELAQRSCFNLPSYACIREGPDHAPRFKASVNFNGEIFESPSYCPTLRQAEHAAAEVALNVLSARGPSRSLTARVLDETGIYKNLLQETAHRAGLNLPVYTTVRSGPGHVPVFTCTVELAGMNFTGEPAKTKKQAEKNAAIAAWSALKRMPNLDSLTNKEGDNQEEQDQAVVSRILSSFKPKDDSKQYRRRDYYQAKRRVVRGHNKDNIGSPSSSSSSSTSGNSLLHRQWRLMDLLMDSTLDGSTVPKQNSFVCLLPPPPPRTVSKILPSATPSNRPNIPLQSRGKSEVKDEEEWVGVKQADYVINNKCIEKEGSGSSNLVSNGHVYGASTTATTTSSTCIHRPVPISSTGKLNTRMLDSATRSTEANKIISKFFASPNPSQMTPTTMGRNMYTGGFNPHRIAPAVKIRSVIPVCAAPPPPSRPQETGSESTLTPATSLNTASASSPSSSMSIQLGLGPAKVSSSASSVLFNNKSQPNSDGLSSEFMNLQLMK
ncbi:hypothetical protein PTKIN_Ptkin07bG0005700 [Pterospermum kingtungense]